MFGIRKISIGLAVAALSLAGMAGNAHAAGTPGPYISSPGCTWIVQEGVVIDSKLTVAMWPQVAAFDERRGVTDGQYVYASFRWYERNRGGPAHRGRCDRVALDVRLRLELYEELEDVRHQPLRPSGDPVRRVRRERCR